MPTDPEQPVIGFDVPRLRREDLAIVLAEARDQAHEADASRSLPRFLCGSPHGEPTPAVVLVADSSNTMRPMLQCQDCSVQYAANFASLACTEHAPAGGALLLITRLPRQDD